MKVKMLKNPIGGLISLSGVDTIYYNSERKSVIGKSGGVRGTLVFAFNEPNHELGNSYVEILSELALEPEIPEDFSWDEAITLYRSEKFANIASGKGEASKTSLSKAA